MLSLCFSILALGMASYALVVALNTQKLQAYIVRQLRFTEECLENLDRELRRK